MLARCLGYGTTGYGSKMENHRNDTLRKNTINFYPWQGEEMYNLQRPIASDFIAGIRPHKLQYPGKHLL